MPPHGFVASGPCSGLARQAARALAAADGGLTLVVTRDGALSAGRGEGRSPLPEGVVLADAKGGEYHAVLLTTDGRLLTCGSNRSGELGSGTDVGEELRHAEPGEIALCR